MARTLLVAWASADWPTLHRLIDAGRMPNLQRLLEAGTLATLASAEPLTRETLFTTLATGLWPDRHGVLGSRQARADWGGVEPAGCRAWRAPALWEVLHAAGLRTAVVNWPATAPADAWPGTAVDDRFATPAGTSFVDWPVSPHSISPPALMDTLAELRVHPADDLRPELLALAPRLREPGAAADRRLGPLAAGLARTATVHAAAEHIAAAGDWDLLCVQYEAFRLLRLAFPNEPADGVFGAVLSQACAWLDLMLGRLVALAGPDATVALVSPDSLSTGPDGRPRAHARGLLVMAGPGIPIDAALPGASLVDIAPTLLARHGLAAPSDGRVLPGLAPAAALKPAPPPPPVPPAPPDPAEDLLALGYADPRTPAQTEAMLDAEAEQLCHLGIALTGRGRWQAAAEALEAARRHRPADPAILYPLARCRFLLGEYENCEAIGTQLLQIDPFNPWGHVILASWCAMAPGAADPEPYLVSARELGSDRPDVLARLGGLELLRGRLDAAEADFAAAEALDPAWPEAAYGLGAVHYAQERPADAETWLRRALVLDPGQRQATRLLGALLLAQHRRQEAVTVLEAAHGHGSDPELATLLDQARFGLAQVIATAATPSRHPGGA